MTTVTADKREAKRTCGFRKGLGRVGSEFKAALLYKLKIGFGLGENSNAALYKRVNGETSLTPLEVDFVESCFLEIDIPEEFVWDL